MAAITQRITNYLGGVSKQSDDKKLPNQVRECLNGYPDPTFGLTKRPGFKWLKNLGTGTTYDNAKWFYIHRDNDEKYIGCIKPASGGGTGDIDIWNATSGAACTVNYGSGAQAYLTGARGNYDILTVQDTSIITNNLHTVTTISNPTYKPNARATLVLRDNPIGKYNVKITDADGSNVKTISEYTSPATATYDTLLTELESRINGLNVSNLAVTKHEDSLYLERNSGNTDFKITVTGGVENDRLTAIQGQVDNVGQLPFYSNHGRIVKIINTESTYDTYFAKFVADNGTSGRGHWAETIDPTVSTGLTDTTMPHELINPSTNTFTFQKIAWTARKVGDDKTNSHPSFVGQKIQQAFFHNNRLGFLSKDNVSMSQTQDFYNFYHISAQTVTDADPVDLSCSSIRPASLHGVVPTTQGLVLFSKMQQFLMSSANGILTPSTTTIRTISNYEMDTAVDPVDMGTNINFISKTPSYTRVFGMLTRGQDENPQILDIGRVVNEWIPATIDTFIASPQNQFLAMSSQSDKKIYFYRIYNDGKENLVEAWFNWELMGTVQTLAVDSDDMYVVSKQGNQVTLSVASLSQSPSDAIIVNNAGNRINPCMDLYTPASNAAGNNKVDYDATNDFSKCYIPWSNVTGLTPVIVIKGTTATGQFTESGFTITPTVVTDDGSDPYFKVEGKDLTSEEDDVIVGWKYNFDIILPKTYVRTDQEQKITDYTATLVISRMKFSVGLSGLMSFKLKSTGIRQGTREYTGDGSTTIFNWIKEDLNYVDKNQIKVRLDKVVTTAFVVSGDSQITFTSAPGNGVKIEIYLDEWYNLNPTQMADDYLANDIPMSDQSVFSIPIHQKSDNFQLRIFNDSPFPVSLNSMMWEGNYSPRFYKRF